MPPKRRYKTQRKLKFERTREELETLAGAVRYVGSAHHKRKAGDYRLVPPSAARLSKTLCDTLRSAVVLKSAQTLLKEGILRGLISPKFEGQFPKRIWAVTLDGEAVEAKLDDHIRGTYHGYPMEIADPMTSVVISKWNKNGRQE